MKVLVSVHSPSTVWNIPEEFVERLRRRFPAHQFLHATSDAQTARLIPEADALFSSDMDGRLFAAARRLQWIHSPAAGVGNMLFPELVASPVVLTNSRGMAADTMAEHVVAVTLALFRRLPDAWRRQAEREWAQDAIGATGDRTIGGSTALIVGLGAVGSGAAWRMAALGARVVGVRRRGTAMPDGVEALVAVDRLREVLPAADIVVLTAPHTRETGRLLDAAALAAMKPEAVLVNVSRGALVDEAALADALAAGRLGGAALDVFEREPLPIDSPLWSLPNVLITPHTSGFRRDHWDAATSIFERNLERFFAGEPLLNVVDKAAGY